jgi:fatty-acid desaturase
MWLPMHIMAVMSFFYFDVVTLIAFLLGYVMVSGFGIAVGYHRFYSHRSFKTYKWIQALMTWGGVLACQGKPIYWVSVHRTKHHPFADTPRDLHSPVLGWWSAYMGWMFKICPKTAKLTGVNDLIKDKIVVWFHRNYYNVLWCTWLLIVGDRL